MGHTYTNNYSLFNWNSNLLCFLIFHWLNLARGFPGGSVIKNLPAMWETRIRSLGWEDPLEMATHSSILAWEIRRTEDPGRLQSVGLQSPTRLSHWACTLLSWGDSPPVLVLRVFLSWIMLDFAKCFFCINWCDHMRFLWLLPMKNFLLSDTAMATALNSLASL